MGTAKCVFIIIVSLIILSIIGIVIGLFLDRIDLLVSGLAFLVCFFLLLLFMRKDLKAFK